VLILSGTIRFIEIILGFRDPIIDVTMAFGLIAAGIGFPLLAYLSFTILWFVNSLLLSILSLRRNP
jgi:Trk-type K+ transport system membrane component